MTVRLRSAIVAAGLCAGALYLTRHLSRNVPKLLMYHRFAGENGIPRRLSATRFERQMRVLKRRCSLMTVSALASRLKHGETVPANTAVVTIDDGYADVYDWAFPILKRLSIPATVYVTTDFVDRECWLWPDLIQAALTNTRKAQLAIALNGEAHIFSLPAEVGRAWSSIADACLEMPEREKQTFIDELFHELGLTRPETPTTGYAGMSWDQVGEMHRAGIEIGAHTRTHPSLAKVDHAERDGEIAGSKRRIEEQLDAAVRSFAYPHGRPCDRDDDADKRVKAAGFASAVMAYHDGTGCDDPYAIRRHGVGPEPGEFRKIVYGYDYLARRIGLR